MMSPKRQAYYDANKERILRVQSEYRARDPEETKRRGREYKAKSLAKKRAGKVAQRKLVRIPNPAQAQMITDCKALVANDPMRHWTRGKL